MRFLRVPFAVQLLARSRCRCLRSSNLPDSNWHNSRGLAICSDSAPYLEAAMSRVPSTMEVGAKNFFCGPESFTPDLGPIVGEAPELRNYFVCAGLNSIGRAHFIIASQIMSHCIMLRVVFMINR